MDVEHCLTVREIRICEIQCVEDKTLVQRLSIMSAKRIICVWHGKGTKKYWNGEGLREKFQSFHQIIVLLYVN